MTHLLDKSAYAIEHTCRFIAIECRGLEPTWNQHWVPSPTFNVAYGLASGVLISHPIEPIAGRRMGHGEDPDMFAKVRELSRVGPVLGILRAMTRALDTAIAKLTTLPSDEQDRIAQWLRSFGTKSSGRGSLQRPRAI